MMLDISVRDAAVGDHGAPRPVQKLQLCRLRTGAADSYSGYHFRQRDPSVRTKMFDSEEVLLGNSSVNRFALRLTRGGPTMEDL